jgi:hypothetical protein
MAEQSMFFDSTDNLKRPITGQLLALMHSMMLGGGGTGVAQEEGYDPLVVSPKQNMTITLGKGSMFIKGYLYNNDTNLDLELDAADPTRNRIDRIVIQFNNEATEREIKAVVKKGIPSDIPIPPSLTRTETVFEMSVAQIMVVAGKSFVESNEISDEKSNDLVCGYLPLHNMLRGIKVNETGIISLPNQSYVEAEGNIGFEIPELAEVRMPFGMVLNKDTQGEVNTTSNEFIPITDGVYSFYVYLQVLEDNALPGVDWQIFVRSDIQTTGVPAVARVPMHSRDNIFSGAVIMAVKKGEKCYLNVQIRNSSKTFTTNSIRIRITKIY